MTCHLFKVIEPVLAYCENKIKWNFKQNIYIFFKKNIEDPNDYQIYWVCSINI